MNPFDKPFELGRFCNLEAQYIPLREVSNQEMCYFHNFSKHYTRMRRDSSHIKPLCGEIRELIKSKPVKMSRKFSSRFSKKYDLTLRCELKNYNHFFREYYFIDSCGNTVIVKDRFIEKLNFASQMYDMNYYWLVGRCNTISETYSGVSMNFKPNAITREE